MVDNPVTLPYNYFNNLGKQPNKVNMMKTVKLYNQDGNRSVGIYQEVDGSFLAMTYSQSKNFKTQKAAEKWLSKFL